MQAIYYGDEIGLEGGKDPDCRRAFPWNSADWKGDLRPWVQTLISARKRSAALRRGDYQRLLLDDGMCAFGRILGDEKVIAAFNFSGQKRTLRVPVQSLEGRPLRGLLDGRSYAVEDGTVTVGLEPCAGVWIT